MVNKYFSFLGSAVLAVSLVSVLPLVVHAQEDLLTPATMASGNAAFIKKSDTMTPVSYTHLDVYKRQSYKCPTSSGY